MKTIINKFLSLYTLLKYPQVPKAYRYFIRDNYFSRIYQIRFFYKDYIKRIPYKSISFHGEFQQELTFALPFAYWHYLNGTLKETVSSKYTKELYFFSPNHKELYTNRDWPANFDHRIPNIAHNLSFDYTKWKAVPLKEKYKNNIFIYEKPIIVIANRFNVEWDSPPISYFDIPTLDVMIAHLKNRFQIIYNRPLAENITGDNSEIKDLNEHDWLKREHPEVLLMQDIYEKAKSKVNNFNHLQLMVYANAEIFISIHGGTATLASYFGGTNIIYSKEGREHYLKEFENLFPQLSGAEIIHVKDSEALKEEVLKIQ